MQQLDNDNGDTLRQFRKRSLDKRPFDIDRELDEVVGKYRPAAGESFWQRAGRIVAKSLIGASLAIAAAAAVLYILDSHVKQAKNAPAPKKPVPVTILPPQK